MKSIMSGSHSCGRPKILRLLRGELERRGSGARIIAKIEKPQALANLDAIVAEADAVMVARGDLGVELDVIRVPAIQKQIIDTCHRARVPVITATQMLNSMESSSRPTRAEASDVFNAVLDGTDAVMLSGESAIGDYPVESVSMMSRIAGEAENLLFSEFRTGAPWTWSVANWPGAEARRGATAENHGVVRAGRVQPITESVVEAASLISRRLSATLLVVATSSGRTALVFSKQRNSAPTLAVANDAQTARAMALYWGVTAAPEAGRGDARRTPYVCPQLVPGTRIDCPGRSNRWHSRIAVRRSHPQRDRRARSAVITIGKIARSKSSAPCGRGIPSRHARRARGGKRPSWLPGN